MTGIVARHLTVSPGPVPALRDVSLVAPRGLVTGVIGPNGAGKTTLVRTIVGLATPDAGTVTVDGRRVRSHRTSVAYLPQRSGTDPDHPIEVGELVAMGRLPHVGLLRRFGPQDRSAIAAAIARVGLQGLERRQIGRLSGGQQQRAHLARALAQDAAAFLLDEPFAGVDAPTITLLVDVLRERANVGSTVLVVLHDLALLDRLCDHVVLLDQRLVAQGTPRDVLLSGELGHAYQRAARDARAGG